MSSPMSSPGISSNDHPHDAVATRPAGPGRHSRPWFALALLPLLAATLAGGLASSCRTTSQPEEPPGLTLALDAVPLLLKADSTSVATIWATVMEYGAPVADSTVVVFATSMGTITAEALTRDGLARATYSALDQGPGVASIVAQVRAVRDTVLVTVY